MGRPAIAQKAEPERSALVWGGEVAIVGGLLMGGASEKAWISETDGQDLVLELMN